MAQGAGVRDAPPRPVDSRLRGNDGWCGLGWMGRCAVAGATALWGEGWERCVGTCLIKGDGVCGVGGTPLPRRHPGFPPSRGRWRDGHVGGGLRGGGGGWRDGLVGGGLRGRYGDGRGEDGGGGTAPTARRAAAGRRDLPWARPTPPPPGPPRAPLGRAPGCASCGREGLWRRTAARRGSRRRCPRPRRRPCSPATPGPRP